jgi:hypothetical protein
MFSAIRLSDGQRGRVVVGADDGQEDMIEKLIPRKRQDMNAYDLPGISELVGKLNEVIAAVNTIRPLVDPLERLTQNAAMLGKVSVPEAEPPEQELTLAQAMTVLEMRAVDFDRVSLRTGSGIVESLGRAMQLLNNARADVIAAAHREYAQPEQKPEQEIFGRIRRLLQLSFPELQRAYRQEVMVRNRVTVVMDDSEIEMLRHLIHVELGTPPGFTAVNPAAQPGKGV